MEILFDGTLKNQTGKIVLDHITISPINPSVSLGIDQQFTVTAHFSDATTMEVTNSASLSSSDTSVAIINGPGLAESLSMGTTTITTNYNGETTNISLTVTEKVLDHITINPTNPFVRLGIDKQFIATAHYSDSTTQDVTSSSLWTSSNTAVATINSSGLAQTNTAGNTTITANYNGETATTVLTAEVEVVSWPFNLTNGPKNGIISVTTDSYDCIIITGYVSAKADFNGDGDTNDGTKETTGYGSSDVFVTKFSSSGSFRWSRRFGGNDGDGGRGIAANSSGNIVVVGTENAYCANILNCYADGFLSMYTSGGSPID